MTRRTLTKKQKFEIDMIYRPKIEAIFANSYSSEKESFKKAKSHLQIVDLMTRSYQFRDFFNSKDELFSFLDTFKDVIKWENIIGYNSYAIAERFKCMVKFLEKYHTFMSPYCWNELSQKHYFLNNDKLVIKYADKLNWQCV